MLMVVTTSGNYDALPRHGMSAGPDRPLRSLQYFIPVAFSFARMVRKTMRGRDSL